MSVPITPRDLRPGPYRILDARGRIEGVVIVQLCWMAAPAGIAVAFVDWRWAGQARMHCGMPAAEFERLGTIEPGRWP